MYWIIQKRTYIFFVLFYGEAYILMKQCKAGTAVLNVDECKMACGYLGISRMGGFKEGRPCYKGGAGGCNQNVRKPGSKATRICKGIQIQIRCSTLYNDVIFKLHRCSQ